MPRVEFDPLQEYPSRARLRVTIEFTSSLNDPDLSVEDQAHAVYRRIVQNPGFAKQLLSLSTDAVIRLSVEPRPEGPVARDA